MNTKQNIQLAVFFVLTQVSHSLYQYFKEVPDYPIAVDRTWFSFTAVVIYLWAFGE